MERNPELVSVSYGYDAAVDSREHIDAFACFDD